MENFEVIFFPTMWSVNEDQDLRLLSRQPWLSRFPKETKAGKDDASHIAASDLAAAANAAAALKVASVNPAAGLARIIFWLAVLSGRRCKRTFPPPADIISARFRRRGIEWLFKAFPRSRGCFRSFSPLPFPHHEWPCLVRQQVGREGSTTLTTPSSYLDSSL